MKTDCMAEERNKERKSKADTEYRAAEKKSRSTELNLQEEAENARIIIWAGEATQRLRIEVERQHELNIKEVDEQKFRYESNARNMQQTNVRAGTSVTCNSRRPSEPLGP